MTIKAYVLMNLATDNLSATLKGLKNVPGVKNVDAIIGPYDAIALIEAPHMDDIGKIVVENMLKVPGVTKTLTCVTV